MPFLVMEFVDGQDLRQELLCLRREGKAVPLGQVLDTAVALCRALVGAHAAGLRHRDIKPANMLTGPDGVVKLADFGMVAMDGGGDAALKASRVAGGAHFTAPELERTGQGDERADIYSVGAVMFAMLAGEPLRFGGGEPSKLRKAGDGEALEWLGGVLEGIVLKALQLDPGKRFSSAAEMLEVLEGVRTAMESGGRLRCWMVWRMSRTRQGPSWIEARQKIDRSRHPWMCSAFARDGW